MVIVRAATPKDADIAVQVVRRSIAEHCTADHHNDAAILTKWLANKTPENFRTWIADLDNFCVVAEVDGKVSGVGLVHRSGKIKLLYLAPGSQRLGICRAIYATLEKKARAWGLRKLHLDSTAMARPFYEALSYQASGEAKLRFGVLRCYPYEKRLESDS